MAFYHERIVPYLIALAMRQRNLVEYRRRVVSAAEGRVLEIATLVIEGHAAPRLERCRTMPLVCQPLSRSHAGE